MSVPPPALTNLLARWRDGDQAALEQLMPLIYHELHHLASAAPDKRRSLFRKNW